ncbi:ATP-binding protein [Dechloromonas sp. A34]|uniref:hybrid sensor histidine kinase/response regulator n=1 Tax=Dechloromonas sp. A34 TaxID=447588 RepID=UPI002248E10B|nr:ATP-binding protein [Dechloromonas sp. A34]
MTRFSALFRRIDAFWPSASLRTYLVAMILLATLPIGLLMGYWIFTDLQGDQQRIKLELQQSANSLGQIVERELVSSFDALTILAGTDAIRTHNIVAFEKTLRSTRAQLHPNWLSAYLLDERGNLLFDTSSQKPTGRSRPSAPPADGANKPAVGKPAPLVDHRPDKGTVVIEVPVLVDGKLRYRLGAWIAATVWQDLLYKAGTPAGAVAGVYDREHRLIARTTAPAAFVDDTLPPMLVGSIGNAAAGLHRTQRSAQIATYDAWKTIAVAGWVVDVGMPAGPFDARHKRAIVLALTTGLACLVLGVVLALLMARRLTHPLDQLATDPRSQAGKRIVIREVAQLRDALVAAKDQEETVQARLKAKRDLLQRKADEFETLFESSPIGLAFAQDQACREVLHNAAMNVLIGPPTAPTARFHQGRQGRLEDDKQPLQRAAARGESVRGLELELVSEGQEPRYVLVSAVPLCDNNGLPRGALSAVVDITVRKRTEAHLASAEKNLRESQRLIELAQEAGHLGFFHYRFETDTMAWTPGLARLFGMAAVARESTLGDFLVSVVDGHRERIEAALRRGCADEQDEETLEFPIRLPDGTERWLSCRIMTNYGDHGRPLQITGVSLDISDQKEAERGRAALIQREHAARLEAEAANRAKDEFLAMLGHELRNPLSAIAAAIEVLNRVDPGADNATSARAVILRQTRHLARLMDDLLDVGRVIAGKILLARQPLNLVPLVERLVATMRLTGVADRHQLYVALDEVWIDADATRIEQVVNNLLTNALKYTPAGGRIDVRVASEGTQAVLEVSDTGVGIHPTLLPKVFDLFVQAERTLDRRAGGLGIGLTLVRRLVELHGGTVGAASSAAGTVFTVRLPAVEAPAGAPQRLLVPPSRRRRIGVIEDNEDALDSLHKLLELDGHSVWCATDGVSGLATLLENRPDVAVVDIGLPGLTGLEVAKRSRAAGYAGRMIALSGYGQDNFGAQAMAAGFDAYMVKPIDAAELRRMLAED